MNAIAQIVKRFISRYFITLSAITNFKPQTIIVIVKLQVFPVSILHGHREHLLVKNNYSGRNLYSRAETTRTRSLEGPSSSKPVAVRVKVMRSSSIRKRRITGD